MIRLPKKAKRRPDRLPGTRGGRARQAAGPAVRAARSEGAFKARSWEAAPCGVPRRRQRRRKARSRARRALIRALAPFAALRRDGPASPIFALEALQAFWTGNRTPDIQVAICCSTLLSYPLTQTGLEPATLRLNAGRSTPELLPPVISAVEHGAAGPLAPAGSESPNETTKIGGPDIRRRC